MRALLVLLAACGGSDDLDATAQGACSNLDTRCELTTTLASEVITD